MSNPPPTNYLRCFVSAVDLGSFTAAAERMGLSPAAVSRNVGLLEQMLGSRLLQRSTRQMRLTPHGKDYYERVRQALMLLDDAQQRLADENAQLSGKLRISTVSHYGRFILLPLLGEFRKQHPGIEFQLNFDDSEQSQLAQDADLLIRRAPASDATAVSRHLAHVPLALVAHRDYLDQRGIPRQPDDLQQHDAVLVNLRGRVETQWRFAPQDNSATTAAPASVCEVRPHPAWIVTGQLDAVFDAVRLGLGIARMAISPANPHLQSGELQLLLRDWRIVDEYANYRGVYMHFRQRRYQSRRLRLLIDFLLEQSGLPQRFDERHFAI